MRLKKEILLFYVLITASAGVIIAAEKPAAAVKQPATYPEKPVKCCKINGQKEAPSFYYFSEGFLRNKA